MEKKAVEEAVAGNTLTRRNAKKKILHPQIQRFQTRREKTVDAKSQRNETALPVVKAVTRSMEKKIRNTRKTNKNILPSARRSMILRLGATIHLTCPEKISTEPKSWQWQGTWWQMQN